MTVEAEELIATSAKRGLRDRREEKTENPLRPLVLLLDTLVSVTSVLEEESLI